MSVTTESKPSERRHQQNQRQLLTSIRVGPSTYSRWSKIQERECKKDYLQPRLHVWRCMGGSEPRWKYGTPTAYQWVQNQNKNWLLGNVYCPPNKKTYLPKIISMTQPDRQYLNQRSSEWVTVTSGRAQPFILGVHSASPTPNAATNYGFALEYNQVSQ